MKSGIFVVLLSLFVILAWQVIDFVSSAPTADVEEYGFEVFPGSSFMQVARRLEQGQFISSALKFKWFATLRGGVKRVRVGEYLLRKNMPPGEVLSIITSGKSRTYSVTFQEGINMYEIADLLQSKGLGNKDEFLKLCRDQSFIVSLIGEKSPSLEGYLFPDTYNITKFTTERELIQMMVKRFKEEFGKIKGLVKVPLTRRDLVTLASIIEKETGAPEERPRISSVFHNRLRKK